MRYRDFASVILSLFVALLLLCSVSSVVQAQAETEPRVSSRPSEATLSEERWLDALVKEPFLPEAMILVIVGLVGGLAVAGLEALDMWRERREEEAARLHARIATAMQRDRLLKNLAVTSIVHLPLWRVSGATIELRGHVPTASLGYALRRTVELEAARSVPVYHLEDRITIVPSMHASTA
jgi:hypothetical protein